MNISSVKFNPSFQKKLMAKGNVLKDNEPCPVAIYKLDKREDKKYLKDLYENADNWKFSYYLSFIKEQFAHPIKYRITKGQKLEFYTIEDSKNNCLGIVEVDNGKKDKQNVAFIETFPENRDTNEFKYIGETLLTFLTKQQQAQEKPREIIVKMAMLEAQDFYVKSHFEYMFDGCTTNYMFLPKENEDLLIESNKFHTNKEIELVG